MAQAFIYCSDGPPDDPDFARRHQQLWSWGGVPLVYRATKGLVQLFRCAHRADFESNGKLVVKPFKTLRLAAEIADHPWWDWERLRNGTLWDDPDVCRELLSGSKAAQKTLIKAVKDLHDKLNRIGILPKSLRRKLLILSILIKYLEARSVFEDDYFGRFRPGAKEFFEVLGDGRALVPLLDNLEKRFNGNVFSLSEEDRDFLRKSKELSRFARFVEAKQEAGGQRTLWDRYSFADLPVELISQIYQLFVNDSATAVYTPHFLVRLMLSEVLSWKRLDRLTEQNEIILDPACGSGVFLVEAYKRLVLHWRRCHDWKSPTPADLKELLKRVHGVDLEPGAVELTAFSLCLALCDALEPKEIRASVKLFPELKEKSIHTGCFFDAREQGKVRQPVGVIVGNPPFTSTLRPGGEQRAYERFRMEHGALPDKQLAYLFLQESMEMLAKGGTLSMLQQYNFLYNQQSLRFRQQFLRRWDVREILDFISVRGLFKKSGTDTKVIVVVAEAEEPPPKRQILHATFRRSGRTDAEQGFDIDYYDMHWLPRALPLNNDGVWRSDLLGGGRVLAFMDRLKKFRRLKQYAEEQRWDIGEGFIVGKSGSRSPAKHLTGQDYLPSEAILPGEINQRAIAKVKDRLFKTSYTKRRFSPPMVLIREHMDMDCGRWFSRYLTYKSRVVGVCGSGPGDQSALLEIEGFLRREKDALRAFAAATSVSLFTQKATTISEVDILSLPYPAGRELVTSEHERILVADIVEFYRDLIRLGENSPAMKLPGFPALRAFNGTFTERINAIYGKSKLRALRHHLWRGVICQPYCFGKGKIDWTGADELKGKVDALLREKRGAGLNVTRIARLYDGSCIYMLKPDRLRYWLRSIALRDADETLADLWQQGF